MKKLLSVILGVFIFTQSAFASAVASENVLSEKELKETISGGVNWLLMAQEANGHFRYEYMPFLDRYILDDNIVRQAGSLYVLGEILRNDPDDGMAVKDAMVLAISYLEGQSSPGTMGDFEFRCLRESEKECTLGGTSLALLGVLDLVVSKPELASEYDQLITDYLNFILAMKKVGAGFRGSYFLTGKQNGSESAFSNGEAFLALVRYNQWKPNDIVKSMIDESFTYFDEIYRAKWDGNFYLWGMAAVKDLYETDAASKYLAFVKDFTDWRMSSFVRLRNSTQNRCAYIEGVTSAYSVLEKGVSEKEREKYLEEINFWLTKSRGLQVKKSDTIKFTFRDRFKLVRIPKAEKAVGGFLTDVGEPLQRIDFTQHCVSGYLQKLVDVDGVGL